VEDDRYPPELVDACKDENSILKKEKKTFF